jgi:hypothetical protein
LAEQKANMVSFESLRDQQVDPCTREETNETILRRITKIIIERATIEEFGRLLMEA